MFIPGLARAAVEIGRRFLQRDLEKLRAQRWREPNGSKSARRRSVATRRDLRRVEAGIDPRHPSLRIQQRRVPERTLRYPKSLIADSLARKAAIPPKAAGCPWPVTGVAPQMLALHRRT